MTLRDGPTVSAGVLSTLLRLERRGLTFRLDGDTLHVGPRDRLTEPDRAFLRLHRDTVKAVVAYCDRLAEVPHA